MIKYKHKATGQIVTKGTDGLFHSQEGGYTLQRWIFENSSDWEEIDGDAIPWYIEKKSPIYTTTDGVEVFEGDRLTLYPLGKDLTIGTLRSFVVVKAFSEQDKEVADRYLTFTSEENRDKYIKENTRKAVFTSADGKEFYSDDMNYSLFSVLPKANWQENRYRLTDCIKFPKKEWLHFHTKEARQEYIDNNKPKYSLADVEKAYKKLMYYDFPDAKSIISELKKLGK
jgi:hypothetical protein